MGLLIAIILIFIIINYIGSNNNSDYKTNSSNKYDFGVTSNKYNPEENNKKSDSQITSTYYIDSGKAIYNGTVSFEGNLDIQEVIVSESVTSIRPFAFATCRNLKKVEIRSLVTSIGNSAFAGCSNLKEIKIPNSIRTIGEYAFAGCSSLREIEIPRSVISIGEFLFKNCNDICVYCNKGSYAEKYAKRNKIYYKYIEDTNYKYINNTNKYSLKETNSEKLTTKNYEDEKKIEFLSAQGINIINRIVDIAYEDFDKMNKNEFYFSIRVNIFDKKLSRVRGNKQLYANSLERDILYCFNLIEGMNIDIVNCIKTKRFPELSSEWKSEFEQLKNKNQFTNVDKARNKDRLDVYKSFDDIDKLIPELEFDYIYFYINSLLLGQSIMEVSKNNDFVRPLFKEFPNAIIKGFEKCCQIKTSRFLKDIKDLFENRNNLEVNSSKTFREFYSSKTAAQLKNDLDEVYYSKLRELNLKDASFGESGSKEFLGAIELALFERKLKPYIEQGIKNVFTRDWEPLDFSEYMYEVVEKFSHITIDEWNESYKYFEENHSWLDKHTCASSEVAMKRFEFLREQNQNKTDHEDKKIDYLKEKIEDNMQKEKIENMSLDEFYNFVQDKIYEHFYKDNEIPEIKQYINNSDEDAFYEAFILNRQFFKQWILANEKIKLYSKKITLHESTNEKKMQIEVLGLCASSVLIFVFCIAAKDDKISENIKKNFYAILDEIENPAKIENTAWCFFNAVLDIYEIKFNDKFKEECFNYAAKALLE